MPKDFDLLAQLAAFARERGMSMTDPETRRLFAEEAVPRLEKATRDQILMFGMRTERMFEALVRSLGHFRLLKTEDNGQVHGADTLRAPDFRIVLDTGEQWLVEVKNVHRIEPFDQVHEMDPAYVTSLRDYCSAVGAPLLVAHFWSLWGLWTLVDVERFMTPDGGFKVTMMDAFPFSRMGELGDVTIALPGPLQLLARIPPQGASGQAQTALYAAGKLLTDSRDRSLALLLLQYGDWPVTGPIEKDLPDGGRLVSFEAAPPEPSEDGFDGIGPASRIFSRVYRAETSADEAVTQLNSEPRPDLFKPLAQWNFAESKLELRLLHMQARTDPFGEEH